jgi:hypothetical protein
MVFTFAQAPRDDGLATSMQTESVSTARHGGEDLSAADRVTETACHSFRGHRLGDRLDCHHDNQTNAVLVWPPQHSLTGCPQGWSRTRRTAATQSSRGTTLQMTSAVST